MKAPLAFLGILVTASAAGAQPPGPVQDLEHPQNTNAGIYAFSGRCASCHDTGKDGAADRHALSRHTPEEVLASITAGSMAQYAQGLSEFQKRVVAVYVGGRPLGAATAGDASQMTNRCKSYPPLAPSSRESAWNGW
jgi:mono/diheme cytochrome c family protein